MKNCLRLFSLVIFNLALSVNIFADTAAVFPELFIGELPPPECLEPQAYLLTDCQKYIEPETRKLKFRMNNYRDSYKADPTLSRGIAGTTFKDVNEMLNAPLCESIQRQSYKALGSDNAITLECRGLLDKPMDLHVGTDAEVNGARDYIYSRAHHTRNINNADSGADDTCGKTNWENVRRVLNNKYDRDPASNHVSMADYITYRCHQANLTCEGFSADNLKAKFNNVVDKEVSKTNNIPNIDKFFEDIESKTKFYDPEGRIIQIPRDFTLAIMKNESGGDPTTLSYKNDYGLFQINEQDLKIVTRDESGVVTGTSNKNYKKNTNPNDLKSIASPYNNIDKFTQIAMSKYNRLATTYNGVGGTFNFNTLSEDEKWKFVSASYNAGVGTISDPLQRLVIFNQAQKCNSCQALQAKSLTPKFQCNHIAFQCEESEVKEACNQTVPVTLGTIERFHNFLGSKHDPDYNQHMRCIKEKGNFSTTKGPCNVGITFTYSRKLNGLRKCF